MKFGEKLKTLRLKNNMTQDDVARSLSISRRAYMAYEQNSVRPRRRETYEKLSKTLNCDINYLLIDDNAILKGATAALSIFGIALGLMIPGVPAGVIAALSTFQAIKHSTPEKQELHNNDILQQCEKKQKLFSVTASGIIYDTLTRKGVSWKTEKATKDETLGIKPDICLKISDEEINDWWFSFWAADPMLDDHVLINNKDRAAVMFCRYAATRLDSRRQVTIVVNDNDLYQALSDLKNNNSYKGNISVALIDVDNVCIKEEEVICFYDENENNNMLYLM